MCLLNVTSVKRSHVIPASFSQTIWTTFSTFWLFTMKHRRFSYTLHILFEYLLFSINKNYLEENSATVSYNTSSWFSKKATQLYNSWRWGSTTFLLVIVLFLSGTLLLFFKSLSIQQMPYLTESGILGFLQFLWFEVYWDNTTAKISRL